MVAALLAAAPAACDDGSPAGRELRLDLSVSPTPAAVGRAQVRVELRGPGADGAGDAAAAPPGARVIVSGRLREEGGAPVTDTAAPWRPGVWIVDAFPFDRPGRWILEARADLPDGRRVVGRHPIRVVGR